MATRFTIRSHRRFPVKCAVDYMTPDWVGKGIVRNLSRGGWRIEGDRTVTPGTILTLTVWLPRESIPVKVERAIVRWVSGRAFGIKILVMEPAEGMKLERLVARLVSPQTLGVVDSPSDLPHGNPATW